MGRSGKSAPGEVEMGGKRVCVTVPASIGNVGSGFDCAGLSLKFYNRFLVERSREDCMKFLYNGSRTAESKTLGLFMKAFNAGLGRLGEKPFHASVEVANRIPFRRGFGSSGTVILAGIISAFAYCGHRIRRHDILDIAVPIEGHSDNLAASLYGGFVLSSLQEGGSARVVSVPVGDELRVVSLIPAEGLSTSEARRVLPEKVEMQDAVFNLSGFGFLCMSFALKDASLLGHGLRDILHQPYRSRLMPHLEELLSYDAGGRVLGACLSGAGPSVAFFTLKGHEKQVARDIERKAFEMGVKGCVRIFRPGGMTSWKVSCQ